MIDSENLDELDDSMRPVVRAAILTIANSGILKIQREANFARILHGSADEPEHELAKRILEHRKNDLAISAFLDLAKQLEIEQ